MTVHISARLAWHDNGWNGCVCKNPANNTYCIGQFSFLGELISERRDLDVEVPASGKLVSEITEYIPCIASINAFGLSPISASMKPPSWFNDHTSPRSWIIPPYTIATWPYEEVYKDEVLNTVSKTPKYDPVKRRNAVNAYFSKLTPDKSLVFHYSNYSNPFSENDQQRYVIVGLSRIKLIGEELKWTDQSEELEKRYGPNVWLRNIVSNYPEEGLRIPYHAYLDKPEILERILFEPDNSRNFKYATRHISDDGALSLIERMAEIVGVLIEIGDNHENWPLRFAWLNSCMAELWHNRGLFPGILSILDYLKFYEAIQYSIRTIPILGEQVVKDQLFSLICRDINSISGLTISSDRLAAVQKSWRLLDTDQQVLLRETLPRFDLRTDQIAKILNHPESVSILSSAKEIVQNPYILCEQYLGMDNDDLITFNHIDHGVLPSPELGSAGEMEADGWQRLRALCVEQLNQHKQHTFLPAKTILSQINRRLNLLPDWKKADFTQRHLEIDKQQIDKALTFRYEKDELYLYIKTIFEDERVVEQILRQLANRPNIRLKFPMTEGTWRTYLYESESQFAQMFPGEYNNAINQQVSICQGIFLRPISILSGSAGTGKTTVISAIIKAIEKAHGYEANFILLAPTGKAADRLRERTGKEASTIHSFLAQHGWLNDNLSFKRDKGRMEETVTTYIIDESSMLDLPLLATLFRSINWKSVQRLIFVGDPNQLPPIGTGRVLADLMDWLLADQPEAIGELTTNMRQIINQLTNQGTGIIDLARLFIRDDPSNPRKEDDEINKDRMLAKAAEGGDIDKDLRVLFWNTTEELESMLLATIIKDMETDSGNMLDPQKPYELWNSVLKRNEKDHPEAFQVISPYRGELFGTDNINKIIQMHKGGWLLDKKGQLGGITYFDKVIQIVNRPKSNPIWAYNFENRKSEKIEIFNGEIGVVKVHGFDLKYWKMPKFHMEKFQVIFSRKPNYWIDYSSEATVNQNLELAYAISVHKSQGSEFQRIYFILPKHKKALLSRELFYTGITRAQNHCTIFIQEDISPILSLTRPESSYLAKINSSLFQFSPTPPELQTMNQWYEEGKIHKALSDQMVRSKSEVIIANMLSEREIPFSYEIPLRADDGTFYLPDFTISIYGENWYWEHLGMLSRPAYREHWEEKKHWYEKHGFSENLIITTEDSGFDSSAVLKIIEEKFGID
ncbi:MAG: AAA family ATPase [Anaerolineaceae bacterium]|nr:AAA family ATPase [Anaerolineaceae bacterium]